MNHEEPDEIHDAIRGAVLATWAPVENPERREATEFAERVADEAGLLLHRTLYKDVDAPISAAELALATSLAKRIGRIAERRLPLWLRANGHDARDARGAYFTGLNEDGEINLHSDGYERRDDRDFTLPTAILLEPDYEATAAAQIAAREAAAAEALAAKEAKEASARERADRTTYERLRARFEGSPEEGAAASEGASS